MTSRLPPNLLKLFTPRPALTSLPPPIDDRPPYLRKTLRTDPVSRYITYFDDDDDTDIAKYTEAPLQRKRRLQELAANQKKRSIKRQLAEYDPNSHTKTIGDLESEPEEGEAPVKPWTSDPYCTLFVARLPNDTSTEMLLELFQPYSQGIVKVVRVLNEVTQRLRPYAFLEFPDEDSLKLAFHASTKIPFLLQGQKLVVDVERGRTVKDWKPRRLGGGLGGSKALALEAERQKRLQYQQSRRSSASKRQYEDQRQDRNTKPRSRY